MSRTLEQLDDHIHRELAQYLGWDYTNAKAGGGAFVARPSLLVPASLVWKPGRKTDTVCSVFLAGVLGCVYPNSWAPKSYELIQVQVVNGEVRPWGLVEAIVASGYGREIAHGDPCAPPWSPRWCVWQGWNGLTPDGKVGPASEGHQGFLAPDGRLLEATTWTDEDADQKSTDPGAVAWRIRPWSKHLERYARLRLVELLA